MLDNDLVSTGIVRVKLGFVKSVIVATKSARDWKGLATPGQLMVLGLSLISFVSVPVASRSEFDASTLVKPFAFLRMKENGKRWLKFLPT